MIVTPAEALHCGLSVFPVNSEKIPIIPHWKPLQSRLPTPSELAHWRRRFPPWGWAYVTGAISGRICLDFDGSQGEMTLQALNLKPHRSTRHGYHVDFQHPGWHVPTLNQKQKEELQARWPGLDIKGDGGYVVFNGSCYRWLRPVDPADDMQSLPADLREFLRRRGETLINPQSEAIKTPAPIIHDGRVSIETLVARAMRSIHTGRNRTGFHLALQLRDNGYTKNEALSGMHMFRAQCPVINTKGRIEPYTESEMQSSLDSAYSKPPRRAWEPRRFKG